MIQIEEAIIRQLITHRVGADEDRSTISSNVADYSPEDDAGTFKKLLLKPFTTNSSTFEFRHEVGIDYNILFNIARSVFEEDDFVENSKKITRYLISVSKHPNIKDGDLFITAFEDIKLGGNYFQALGIYKFEDKETYIETTPGHTEVKLQFKKGIGSKKPDKACLIIFTAEPYTLLVIDSSSSDTDYWQNEFIKHKPKNDFVNNTHDFLGLTKNFITQQIPQDFNVSRADQIDLLNRSVEYFKTHDTFDKNGFEEDVFHHENIIESFRKFDQTYQADKALELSDNFEISQQAVKKQARIFKSVLKLDKNFHVYIHGNRELIQQGVDENGRKYYKIYYENES